MSQICARRAAVSRSVGKRVRFPAGREICSIGKSFIKSFAGVCLGGAIIVLACIIYSLFAGAAPSVDTPATAITQVWTYIGEIIFNMLVLVGTVKLSDQVVGKMMGI